MGKSRSFARFMSDEVMDITTTSVVGENEEDSQKSYLDDGFIFGLQGSGIDRPRGKVAQVVVEGDSLETQPWQVALVSTTFAAQLGLLGFDFVELLGNNAGNMGVSSVEALTVVMTSWILADLGSGVLHWSVDNYGNGRTPIMGGIIAAFQGHHAAPWTITERGFCNNVWKLCIPFGIPTVAAITALTGPMTSMFFTVFCMMEILSQELHKWSHMSAKEVPAFVNVLQKIGLSINRVDHAAHHTEPYDGNYCIISGICNEALDTSGFFRRLEHIVYDLNGVESNAWKLDGELREKTLRGEYSLEI